MTANGAVQPIPRSILYTPALSLDRLTAAWRYDADLFLIDLEDSVPPPAKARGREICLAALKGCPHLGRVAVRLNELASMEAVHDIAMLSGVGSLPGFLVMTMVRSAAEPALLRSICTGVGWKPQIYVTIETVEAIAAINEIADMSDGLVLGSADLAATLAVDISWAALLQARQSMALASARREIGCIDTGNFQLNDASILQDEALRAKALGFHGKGTVHPKELATINETFHFRESEIAHAERVIAAAEQSGNGVCMLDGGMIGPPFVRKARRVLARHAAWQRYFGERTEFAV